METEKMAQELVLIEEMVEAVRGCQVNAKTETLKKICEEIVSLLPKLEGRNQEGDH
eukprot:gnl/Chilomastix_caulleri/1820.p1 GENE.gnl/Chilomastix_caulleri/1820~~gnl/Chilomastix_caulleri/1820.p1  ORF type:complete len:56 (+),score=11.42 gnl/Chilomastix_caulleri/1820:88-255(+)